MVDRQVGETAHGRDDEKGVAHVSSSRPDAPDVPPSEVEAASAELDKVRSEWLAKPAVTGVDVGLQRGGDGLSIRVYVSSEDSIEEAFPERIGRFPVEVVKATFGPQS
jgi:hypothetical protein